MASGLPPVSFREVNGRQKALVTSVMTRCETLKVGLLKELEEFRQDESADRDKFLEIGVHHLCVCACSIGSIVMLDNKL